MGDWPSSLSRTPSLHGSDGELVAVRMSVEPRFLEDALEALAHVPFPINPQIYHGRPTVVEFPAYENQLEKVRGTLRCYGFSSETIAVRPVLEAITA